ncbi:MAG: hypothetical protein JO005_10415, partial [Gammaproteobacteria bacterium]|nr:hypothetical protein [Gammaproteobacteria bacterium]
MPTSSDPGEADANLAFPLIGIGASAGGIEALKEFFSTVPDGTNMTFVVVQHLPPQHESMMAEILRRATPLPVQQITDGMRLEAGTVYVTRPGHTLTLGQGRLHLGAPVDERGHRRPIDDFFRSLAAEQGGRAIAVVLAGFGSNGTAGAQAIKAAGGLCLAQDPGSTEFPGMPSSLIHAGYADEVLKPSAMPPMLVNYLRRAYAELPEMQAQRADEPDQIERMQMTELLSILRARTGHDFSGYKRPTLLRRTQRRMSLIGSDTLQHYATLLRERPEEAQALANDLMINVTGFFRDPEAWETLRTTVIRPLIDAQRSTPLRAWVSGCATGEEAYSLAMLFSEELEAARRPELEVKIFATDASERPLAFARAGNYPGGIEGDISTERLDRFFEKEEHSYRVTKHLRDMVIFAPQDVLRDPPFSRLDLCTCRNLLIYLEPDSQRRVLNLLHFAIREGGYLFLGNAETLGSLEESFETINKKWRIYRRARAVRQVLGNWPTLMPRELSELRRGEDAPAAVSRQSTPLLVQRALFEQFGPPTLVVDRHDRIVYFHGRTAVFLDQPVGEPTRDLFEVLKPALRRTVRAALRQAMHQSSPVTVTEQPGEGPGGVTITAAPLTAAPDPQYFRISFEERPEGAAEAGATASPPAHAEATDGAQPPEWQPANALEEELRIVRRELQSTVEAYEAGNEELKAANEEV